MAMGVDGTNPTDGTAETAGITAGTALGALAVATTGTIHGPLAVATTGTIHGAGTVLGATADTTMVTVAMVATAVLAASAATTDGTIKAGAEPSLAAVAPAEVLPNLPPTTEYGASKFNQELCPTDVRL